MTKLPYQFDIAWKHIHTLHISFSLNKCSLGFWSSENPQTVVEKIFFQQINATFFGFWSHDMVGSRKVPLSCNADVNVLLNIIEFYILGAFFGAWRIFLEPYKVLWIIFLCWKIFCANEGCVEEVFWHENSISPLFFAQMLDQAFSNNKMCFCNIF